MKMLVRFALPTTLVALVAIAAATLAFGAAGPKGNEDSLLNGSYSFRLDAADDSLAYDGYLEFDGNGSLVAGHFSVNRNGSVSHERVDSGTYTVSSDGTGTLRIVTVPTSGGLYFVFEFDIAVAHKGDVAYALETLASQITPIGLENLTEAVSGELMQQ